jgi:hypothetical protein
MSRHNVTSPRGSSYQLSEVLLVQQAIADAGRGQAEDKWRIPSVIPGSRDGWLHPSPVPAQVEPGAPMLGAPNTEGGHAPALHQTELGAWLSAAASAAVFMVSVAGPTFSPSVAAVRVSAVPAVVAVIVPAVVPAFPPAPMPAAAVVRTASVPGW